MLKLCGFPVSAYYNKVKFYLLEKRVPFEEELAMPSQEAAFLAGSPMGKVPFLRTEHGILTESQAIIEYIEDRYTELPLYPRKPFERARCRELIAHLELYVELPARRLFEEVFFGRKVADATRAEVEQQLERGLRGLARLARFDPFLWGHYFTLPDVAAFIHLPSVSLATQKVYGRDFVAELLPQSGAYLARIGERRTAQQVMAARQAALEAFAAKNKK
ncbi:MAG TPA: glutathione S-transferase [Candidatus Desulfobacillus sp.]|nr:glutathione S-transferase [Candidatus Desulfobacillus sp.]